MEMEIKTDLPPFLLRREVESWRSKNQGNLKKREERWQKVEIKDPSLQGEDLGNIGLKYIFQTPEGQSWQIFLGKNDPKIGETISLPDRLLYEFELRQQFFQPENPVEINRQKAQDFLAANWETIFKIFYSNSNDAKRDDHLPVYTNVKLDEDTIIDLVAFGPDGRMFVINFGQQDKNLHKKIEDLIRVMNLESQPLLTIINGLTSFTTKVNNLILSA